MRREIVVLFYKADFFDGHLLDDAISFYTGLLPCNWGTKGYSHVEIYLPHLNLCFSSTTRGDSRGVRFASFDEVCKYPERWDALSFFVDSEHLDYVVKRAEALVGLGYDYLGLGGFFIPLDLFNQDHRWYCSEIVCWFLWMNNIMERYNIISPRRLSKKVIKISGRKPECLKKIIHS